MKKLLFLLLLTLLTPSVAGITLDLNANFAEPILLPNESSLLSINLTLDSNVTGANLLLIDVIYDSGKGWNYSAYSASINGKAMGFNVSEADVNVSGALKHRITFANSGLNISQPASILLDTYLKTPEVNLSSYAIDVIALWSYPGLNVTQIKNVSLNITVSKPELYPSSIVFSNENPLKGENITITAAIHNTGGRANASVALRVDGIQKANTTRLFNAASVQMINFSWVCIEGKHSIEIVVDPENDVDEINETNNSISREINVIAKKTVPSAPSGGGGGGGLPKNAVEIPKIKAGESYVAEFSAEHVPDIASIEIFAAMDQFYTKISVETHKEKPGWVIFDEAPGEVYRYFRIRYSKPNTYITKAKITFKVNESWLKSKDIDPASVVMYRLSEAKQWEKLDTTPEKAENGTIYYTAETPGFSWFAVSAKEDSGFRDIFAEEDRVKPAPTPPKPEEKPVVTLPPEEKPAVKPPETRPPVTEAPAKPKPTPVPEVEKKPERRGICGPTLIPAIAMLAVFLGKRRR